ncbi:MAG: helix-turn-helix domain-containing protein, partial [Acidimicrobiia bacterium]
MRAHPLETRVEAARLRANGLSQPAIAAKLGVSQSVVSNWLAGTTAPAPAAGQVLRCAPPRRRAQTATT